MIRAATQKTAGAKATKISLLQERSIWTIGMIGLARESSDTGAMNEVAPSLLSSQALPHSVDDKKQREHQNDSSVTCTTKAFDFTKIDGVQEIPVSISRPLSRSCSRRNLQQNVASFSSSLDEQAQQFVREKKIKLGSPQSHCFSSPAPIEATSIACRSKSSPATFQKEELPKISLDNEMKPSIGTTKKKLFPMKPTTGLLNCPTDSPCKDVYRSFEMKLPDCDAGGYILPDITKNGTSKIVDDYNYEIFSFNPLQDPPRLPNAMESFMIAERSREEKNNWGWYA